MADPKDNQPVTHARLLLALRAIGQTVKAEVADPMTARLDTLEKRIAALEGKSL